jgi:Nuclease-related domain
VAEERSVIRLRYAARCASCDVELAPMSEAHWDKESGTATCRACFDLRQPLVSTKTVLERGVPGASAAREWTKRHDRREAGARERFGRLSGLYLTFNPDPQSTQAWAVGNNGEVALGRFLAALDDDSSIIVLPDRRIPKSRANIDHIAITRNGIHAIDAKNYKGKVQAVDKGGWFSTDWRLYVGHRDCTRLARAMAKQVDAIRAALGVALLEEYDLPVKSALCFVDAEWPLIAKPLAIESAWIGWPKALGERLRTEGPLAPEHVRLIAERVASALPHG